MFSHAPAVVLAALAVVQLVLGAVVARTALLALATRRRARTAADTDAAEIARLRPVPATVALLAIVLISVPALVALLGSHVGEWPGAMCIDGITRIGERSRGAAGWLPTLLRALAVTKPLCLVLVGAWMVSHAVERRAGGRPGSRGPFTLAVAGALAALDAVAGLAYAWIPKEDDVVATGCCLATPAALRSSGASLLERWECAPPDSWAFVALGAAFALFAAALLACRRGIGAWPIVAGAAVALGLLVQHVAVAIASPVLHGVASHRCIWCVVENTPTAGAALFSVALTIGAAGLGAYAALLERPGATGGGSTSRSLAGLALLGLAAALAFTTVDVVLGSF